MYDVVVVGGGLAGAATAIHLARRGRSVLVIEQRAFPRQKVCGEGMLRLGTNELERLGLRGAAEAAGEPLHFIRFAAGEHRVEAPLLGQGVGIRRTTLDALVLDAARAAGAEVRQATVTGLLVANGRAYGVECLAGETYRARVVVGADGLHSRVRRLTKLESGSVGDRYGAAVHARGRSVEQGVVSVSFHGTHEMYITPVGDDAINVVMLLRRKGLRELGHNAPAEVAMRLASDPALAGLDFEEPVRFAGPFPRTARAAYRGNVILAGDAAGFFDGITGEGMGLALAGARLCANAITAHLETRSITPFREYEQSRRALARNSTLLGKLTLAISSRPRIASLAIRNLARQPATFERLVAISGGAAGLRSLRPADLVGLLAGQ